MQENKEIMAYSTILAAVTGDIDAIHAVIKKYEGYIACLSMRRLYDECGNSFSVVDEELCRRLEIKLITKILKFKIV